MEILLTGGTGFVGSRVLTRLIQAGHAVTAVVRSEKSRSEVETAGARGVVGDLFDPIWFGERLGEVDGAIHTASGSDEHDATMNDAVIDAVLATYAGTPKPFVLTGGVWTYGSSADLTETSPYDPPEVTAWRVEREQRLLASDVKASVVQPGIVYGDGQGIVAALLGGPRTEHDELVLIGSGDQHWATVHVDDLADLYVLVLEQAPGGAAYIGANGDNPTVREIGEAAGPVAPGSADEASTRLGGSLAQALLLDQQASGEQARALGWEPASPRLVDLVSRGYDTAG